MSNLPAPQNLFGPMLPPAPKPRSESIVGRYLTNIELNQIKTRMILQADILEEVRRATKAQEDIMIEQFTANQKVKTMLAEYSARETIAEAKAEEAAVSALEKKLEFRLKRSKIEAMLDE